MKLDLVIKIPDVKVFGKALDFTILSGKVYDPDHVAQLMALGSVGNLVVRSFEAHCADQVNERVNKAAKRYTQLWSQGFYKLEPVGNFSFIVNDWAFEHLQTGTVDYDAYPAGQNTFVGLQDI
jgi:hypothetical protein